MGALGGIGPWFTKLAQAADTVEIAAADSAASDAAQKKSEGGRVHVVESNDKTVRLGVYDTTLDPILKIDSGDTISYPNTWSHFLNQIQPAVQSNTLPNL